MDTITGLVKGVTAKNCESLTVSLIFNYDAELNESLSALVVDADELKTGNTAEKQVVLRKAEPSERTGQLVLGGGDD